MLETIPLSRTLEDGKLDIACSHLHVSDSKGLAEHNSVIHHQRANPTIDQHGTDALVPKRGPGTVTGIVLGVEIIAQR